MALQDALLAALAAEESSGYDLAKAFDVTVANFWSATPQQLYRELDRMEGSGLIDGRVVEQERRPNKRVFSLTEAGRLALRESTTRRPRPTAIRDELLVQVEALDDGDRAGIRRSVEERLAASRAKLDTYRRSREHRLAGRSESEFIAAGVGVGPYLTLARGIAFEEENVRWCELVLSVVEADRGE